MPNGILLRLNGREEQKVMISLKYWVPNERDRKIL